MKTFRFFAALMLAVVCVNLSSCSKDDEFRSEDSQMPESKTIENKDGLDKETYFTDFAEVLSKATYERKDVREFLKAEALKQFDKNYDILYYLVKDEEINGTSFRDILMSYSSSDFIESIEANVPLLNILTPEIAVFDVNPEDLDTADKEIPIAVSKQNETLLFLNGKKEVSLEKGEIPDFHLFVVNENSRVIVPSNDTRSLKSNLKKSITFKSPNFDRSLDDSKIATTRSIAVSKNTPGEKAISAYNYFNKDDGSDYQIAFQRDYIYYGITPENKSGSLNRSVSEYIGFLEINPRTYFKISDQIGTNSTNDDPYIKETETTQKKRELSEDELLDRMWTKGAYDFRFEIVTSTNQHPQIVYIPLKPNEIWNFNIKHDREHATMFRHSKNTYKIDPNKFTSKTVYLGANKISFGKWDLSEESIYRYVNILEEDESVEKTYTNTYESTRVHTNKFNGDVKLELGLGESDKISGGASGEVTNSNTIRENRTVTIIRKEKSDELGSIRIYFYDPIIRKKYKSIMSERYIMHTYNTGHVTFGITTQ